ncbi:hypothetical protein JQ604_06045 [Bradyrhizobium jicamae]|uniref:hypothetical protein n=1 Tax=Bradyrhizobium jicamae TaxID=280332 RepID=UPI001BA765A1|nr:hypothetical protein [Bradyrhizobium jicamae]MBR0751737.1 hypothetical protein [Bradyrhizobium jicamae]
MPIYTIQLPDGRHLDAEAEDENSALAGAQDWYAANVTNKTDTSITGALAQGASDLVRGVGKTVKEYVAPDAGKSIEAAGASLAGPRYKSAMEQFSQPEDGADNHVLGRDWSKLPRVLVEQAPGVLTDLAVSRLMKRLGPVGQVVGGMMSHGLRIAGNEAQKRATARTGDESAEPTLEDKAVGAGSTLAQAALNQIAVNKVLSPAKVGVGASGVTQAARNALTAAATEGVTNAAQDAISQAASTVGTKYGLAIDPHSLADSAIVGGVGGGVLGAPKSVKDAASAVRFRDMGGDLTPASAAAANRMAEKAGSVEALQSPSKAFHAVTDTHTDVMRELSQATTALRKLAPLPVEADNALARATKGNDLTDGDLAAIEALDGGESVKDLAKQAVALARLKSTGSYDPAGERFSGGVAETARKFVKNNPLLSGGAYTGGNALLAGVDGLTNALGSHALPAIGAYIGTRAVERALGVTAPARTFAEKFTNPDVPVRTAPPLARPQSPTGPKVSPPSLSPPQPWGPIPEAPQPFKPDVVEPGLRKLVDKLERTKRQEVSRDVMPLLRQLAAQGKLVGNETSEPTSRTASSQQHASGDTAPESQASPYAGLTDAEVRTKAVQDAVEAGVIPDLAAARERYGQGVQRKRDTIREAVHKAANSDGYTDADVEAFQPFLRRLVVARTREEANTVISEAAAHVSSKARQALMRHVGGEFINRTWKK